MNKRKTTSPESCPAPKEKKLEKIRCGKEEQDYVLFRGEAVYVTEIKVICLRGPMVGEDEQITVSVKGIPRCGKEEEVLHYMIGKGMKLRFLIDDYCDRHDFSKSTVRFLVPRVGNWISDDDKTSEELGIIGGEEILCRLR